MNFENGYNDRCRRLVVVAAVAVIAAAVEMSIVMAAMTAGIGKPESGDGRFVVARTVIAGVIISIVGRTIGHGRITAVATGAVIVAKPSVGAPAVVTAMIIARASHTDTDRYLRGCRC